MPASYLSPPHSDPRELAAYSVSQNGSGARSTYKTHSHEGTGMASIEEPEYERSTYGKAEDFPNIRMTKAPREGAKGSRGAGDSRTWYRDPEDESDIELSWSTTDTERCRACMQHFDGDSVFPADPDVPICTDCEPSLGTSVWYDRPSGPEDPGRGLFDDPEDLIRGGIWAQL